MNGRMLKSMTKLEDFGGGNLNNFLSSAYLHQDSITVVLLHIWDTCNIKRDIKKEREGERE